MRIAFLGTHGPLTTEPLERLASAHEVVALVRAAAPRGLRAWVGDTARSLGLAQADPLSTWARAAGAEVLWAEDRRAARVRKRLSQLDVDVICISTYRWILGPEWLCLPRTATLNLHASLLPRHRGANPFFWLYHSNDRRAGVTVHHVDPRVDAGPILAQDSFELPRGRAAQWTGTQCAERGAQLLLGVLAKLERGACPGRAQEEAQATRAPLLTPDFRAVDFDRWEAERVWHFLAGVLANYREPLLSSQGEPIRYGSVLGYESTDPGCAPGTVRPDGEGWRLACIDGVVRLGAQRGVEA